MCFPVHCSAKCDASMHVVLLSAEDQIKKDLPEYVYKVLEPSNHKVRDTSALSLSFSLI